MHWSKVFHAGIASSEGTLHICDPRISSTSRKEGQPHYSWLALCAFVETASRQLN